MYAQLLIIVCISVTVLSYEKDTQQSVSFENACGEPIDIYWKKNSDEQEHVVTLPPDEKQSLNTFTGHEFIFQPQGSDKVIQEVTIVEDQGHMIIYPEEDAMTEKDIWMKEYYERTGKEWLNFYPREPVTHHYHEAKQGEVINIETDRTKFHVCKEGELNFTDMTTLDANQISIFLIFVMYVIVSLIFRVLGKSVGQNKKAAIFMGISVLIGIISIIILNVHQIKAFIEGKKSVPMSFPFENDNFYIDRVNDTTYCRPKSIEKIEVVNICAYGPNAFRIDNFLSDDEMEHIKNFGLHKGLERSTVGEGDAIETTAERTSQTVWLERDESFIMDNIVRRIAKVVNISQEKLFMNASAEELQLVHYFENEWYRIHYDYEAGNKPQTRYITFLMYLNEVDEGGNTSFPSADKRCHDENGYFGVQPIKGSAAFFYNMFPDGNVDPKTVHQAEPPTKGAEKWMSNLWIWDDVFAR